MLTMVQQDGKVGGTDSAEDVPAHLADSQPLAA